MWWARVLQCRLEHAMATRIAAVRTQWVLDAKNHTVFRSFERNIFGLFICLQPKLGTIFLYVPYCQ